MQVLGTLVVGSANCGNGRGGGGAESADKSRSLAAKAARDDKSKWLRMITSANEQRTFEFEAEIGVLRSQLGAHDAAFDHAVSRRCVRDESGWNGHFQHDIFFTGRTLHGDQCTSGADINGSTEFEDGSSGGVGPVYKNGKGNG